METRYLEELIKTINNADLAICGYRTVSYSGEEIVQEIEFKNALKGVFSDYAEELCVLHKNTLLFGPCNKLFQASIIYENNDIRFGLTKRYEDTTFIYRYLLHCSSISFTPACLYRYSKFLHGRKTAVTSFGNEQCEGAFIAYEEGQKVVQHMIDNRMNPDAIMRFERRLEKHLETSIFGEAIVSVSCSSLTWKERKHYIKAMIQRFHGFLPAFSKGDVKSVDKAARMMANKGFYDGIVALSYLYQFKHCK